MVYLKTLNNYTKRIDIHKVYEFFKKEIIWLNDDSLSFKKYKIYKFRNIRIKAKWNLEYYTIRKIKLFTIKRIKFEL